MLHQVVEQHRRCQDQDPEQNRFSCRIQLNPQLPASAGTYQPGWRLRHLRRWSRAYCAD
jgi:hypothetical protein